MMIAEVSEKYCIPADTLRYYERIGLIPRVHRNKSGMRDYTEEDCKWVEFIKCMRGAGLPIEVLIEYVALFQQGDREDSLFWFYAGQLRARFDANRCADVSARAAVGALNEEYGPPINRYAFRNLAQLEELIPKVVAWDRRTPHDYDHRWINLHGMGALTGGDGETRALSLPQEQWQAIAERTRDDYLRGFREAMAQAKQVGSEERETPRDE